MNSIVQVRHFDVGYNIPKKEIQSIRLPTIKSLESSELSNRVPFKDYKEYLRKRIGKSKHEYNELPQINNSYTTPNEVQLKLRKNITIRQVNEQKELEQYKLKIILNEKMQNKLKTYAKCGLNNIPVNEKLLEKAIFKYKQKDRFNQVSKERRNLSNIIQSTLGSQDLNQESVIYYCKQKGVKGLDVDKILHRKSRKPSITNVSLDVEQMPPIPSSGLRVQRAKSHNYFIMKQSQSSIKKRKAENLNQVLSQSQIKNKFYFDDRRKIKRSEIQDQIQYHSLDSVQT